MQRHLRELKEKSCDQDRVRSDLITRFSTERSSWEIERANLHSQINQVRGEEGLGLEIERANLHSQINQVRGEEGLGLEIERANLHSQINQVRGEGELALEIERANLHSQINQVIKDASSDRARSLSKGTSYYMCKLLNAILRM